MTAQRSTNTTATPTQCLHHCLGHSRRQTAERLAIDSPALRATQLGLAHKINLDQESRSKDSICWTPAIIYRPQSDETINSRLLVVLSTKRRGAESRENPSQILCRKNNLFEKGLVGTARMVSAGSSRDGRYSLLVRSKLSTYLSNERHPGVIGVDRSSLVYNNASIR
ncbi:hypothetical protein BIW11_03093 [Tropilaelaps mercedesae]|uniref:Uncharacterized protein n=1 Tax=Tropilaelaps mercedesae TaxID=418985 RepID=A0A1V9XS90_9ACAR|nr:hypothetical protein BIW11_03093 [Tropilaelaps mercedesae]